MNLIVLILLDLKREKLTKTIKCFKEIIETGSYNGTHIKSIHIFCHDSNFHVLLVCIVIVLTFPILMVKTLGIVMFPTLCIVIVLTCCILMVLTLCTVVVPILYIVIVLTCCILMVLTFCIVVVPTMCIVIDITLCIVMVLVLCIVMVPTWCHHC